MSKTIESFTDLKIILGLVWFLILTFMVDNFYHSVFITSIIFFGGMYLVVSQARRDYIVADNLRGDNYNRKRNGSRKEKTRKT